MWGDNSENCELGCQCSGLITDSFKINSGNGATKHRREESISHNFKFKMNPLSLDFTQKSPLTAPTPSKRRVLGEITNTSPTVQMERTNERKTPLIERNYGKNSPLVEQRTTFIKNSPLIEPGTSFSSPLLSRVKPSPLLDRISSPLTAKSDRVIAKRSTSKISRIFEERTQFKLNKENETTLISETFVKLQVEEETRHAFDGFERRTETNWSMTKLDFTDALQSTSFQKTEKKEECFVPEKEMETDMNDFETLQDLEAEFENDSFEQCTKYEIISTDSPDIISRGRSSSRKINARNFSFGAPLLENEASTSFNKPSTSTNRTLDFEDSFTFTSPPIKKCTSNLSVKKSLKFTETPTKNPLRHEKSDSSIGSMFSSPASSRIKLFTSESTTSMESGFISELEEPFLELEDQSSSNSPKIANFNDLLTGQIKENVLTEYRIPKRQLLRTKSYNPDMSKAKISLLSVLESPDRRSQKRSSELVDSASKRRKADSECGKIHRPMLQRAFSENNASIMSALAKSSSETNLIGDFTQPFALPLVNGDHSDLISITCDTLASLIKGEYDDTIINFKVIDCRYPYEFQGGHIKGAVNLYTPEQVQTLMNEPKEHAGRTVLVFHCEFSLQRGPKLSRYLRSSDRARNIENYPSLNFPEIYLLHGGYRAFFQKYPDMCLGSGYTPMLCPDHKHLLKRHRSMDSGKRKMY